MANRIVLVLADHLADVAVECRRVEDCLAVVAGLVEEAANNREEPHVSHPVGFVDNDNRHVLQRHDPLGDEIFEPAWRGDEYVDPAAQLLDLWGEANAAIDGKSAPVSGGKQRLELGCDLGRELARWCEHKSARQLGLRHGHHAHEGHAEGERLTGAGGGPPNDVAPGEKVGDCRSLDGERRGDAGGTQRSTDRIRHAEIGEGGGHQALRQRDGRWRWPATLSDAAVRIPVRPAILADDRLCAVPCPELVARDLDDEVHVGALPLCTKFVI